MDDTQVQYKCSLKITVSVSTAMKQVQEHKPIFCEWSAWGTQQTFNQEISNSLKKTTAQLSQSLNHAPVYDLSSAEYLNTSLTLVVGN
jgi:hypothetical protein